MWCSGRRIAAIASFLLLLSLAHAGAGHIPLSSVDGVASSRAHAFPCGDADGHVASLILPDADSCVLPKISEPRLSGRWGEALPATPPRRDLVALASCRADGLTTWRSVFRVNGHPRAPSLP